MKEIKAYIQRDYVNRTVDELQRAGAPGITIVEIHPVGYDFEPNCFETRFEDVFKRYSYLRIVKLEVVCADCDAGRLVQIIRKECCTCGENDGVIFVSGVDEAVRIRDGACGAPALRNDHMTGKRRSESEATTSDLSSRSRPVSALKDRR